MTNVDDVEIPCALASVVRSSLNCIVIVDEKGTITDFNAAAERTMGYARDEIVGRSAKEFIHPSMLRPQDRLEIRRFFEERRGGENALRAHVDWQLPDGRLLPIEATITAIQMDGPDRFLCSIRDLSGERSSSEQLEESRRRLELAVDGAKLGTWTFDLATGATWYSDRSKQMYGLPPETEMSTAVIRSAVHPDHWDEVADPYLNGFRQDKVEVEYRVRCPDGSTRWIYSLGALAKDKDGIARSVNGIHLDITERKRAEAALEETRRQLDLAVEGLQIGLWSVDPNSGSVWHSDTSRRLWGMSDDLTVDVAVLKTFIHPDDWEVVRAPYRLGFPEDTVSLDHRIVRPDGELRWIHALGKAQRDDRGAVTMVYGIHLDATERKAAEAELEEARLHLEMAIDAAGIGIWRLDPATGAAWYSDRSRNLWGVEHELHLDAERMWSHIHPEDRDKVLEPYRNGFPSDVVDLEHRVVWPNGDVRWVHSIGKAERDAGGAVRTVSGIHLDITERKSSETELARSREALHQSEKLAALGSLLAGVSHELNNPLAAIVGQAEMLEEDAQGTPLEARAKKISAAADRCARIVQTFLAMARRREPDRVPTDPNGLVSAALQITEYALRTSGIAVTTECDPHAPAILGDRDQLHQVLVNLIINAQQALETSDSIDRRLCVRSSVTAAGTVAIDVVDNGPGIPEAVRGRIFEPFFTTKPQGSGTGLGLSFSHGIVSAHGGRLEVLPSERGATFRIELPAAAPISVEIVKSANGPPPAMPQVRRTALVVDDESDIAETIGELLEREGFDVTIVSDGAAALMALDHDEFDIVLSDLRMPGVSGPEMYQRLSELRPQLLSRIAFVTGDTLGASMDAFLRETGRPVLEKPFTRAGVRCLVQGLIEP
ncbi:MAG TPA: PAS domain S-box protein [Allosphingosinicella sp.]